MMNVLFDTQARQRSTHRGGSTLMATGTGSWNLYCYIVILLYRYIVILLYCYIVILLYCYIVCCYNDEFCFKNDKICHRIRVQKREDDDASRNRADTAGRRECIFKKRWFFEYLLKFHDFCITNDELCIQKWWTFRRLSRTFTSSQRRCAARGGSRTSWITAFCTLSGRFLYCFYTVFIPFYAILCCFCAKNDEFNSDNFEGKLAPEERNKVWKSWILYQKW